MNTERILPLEAINEEEKNNVVELKLVKTDREAPPPTGNWLVDMKPGTVFLAKDLRQNENFVLLRLQLVKAEPKAAILFIYKNFVDSEPFGEVDPTRFINRFGLVKVLAEPTEQEEEQEEESTDG